MIWFRGGVVSDEAVRIGVSDRTFEHGLGLFETFRTWEGHPTLLDRHLARLRASAGVLGLMVAVEELPDAEAVRRLAEACAGGQVPPRDLRLRIVLSGGSASERPVSWMTAGALPPSIPRGARIARAILTDPDDPLARHKTLNYWRRRIEQERAAAEGADEVLCVTPGGLVCEGTRSNVFLVRDGRLITPGADGPLLNGVMRRVVIERARGLGIGVEEGPVPTGVIDSADEAFLTNSVRGILPLAGLLSRGLPAPGPITQLVWDDVIAWLNSGGSSR